MKYSASSRRQTGIGGELDLGLQRLSAKIDRTRLRDVEEYDSVSFGRIRLWSARSDYLLAFWTFRASNSTNG
jgi:hypothetical protein